MESVEGRFREVEGIKRSLQLCKSVGGEEEQEGVEYGPCEDNDKTFEKRMLNTVLSEQLP